MTNQEESQEKGLRRMRRMRIIVGIPCVFIVIAVLYWCVPPMGGVTKFFILQAWFIMEAIKITIALIQNHIAKKRGWPAPYGSFMEII